jgi:hypothetical protein
MAKAWSEERSSTTIAPSRSQERCGEIAMSKLGFVIGLVLFSGTALAAGIDPRVYTCAGLHGLLATNRFVFIGLPSFQDFVVANGSYCGGGEYVQVRSVPTSDIAECPVNYCISRPDAQR